MGQVRPRNYDGGIWRLRWEHRPGGGYRAWVMGAPEVAAEGQVWQEVEESLYEAIRLNLQAGEWTVDWDPPPPLPEGANYREHPEYVVLVPDGVYYALGEIDSYWAGGLCRRCGWPRGERTGVMLSAYVEVGAGIMMCAHPFPGPDLFNRKLIEALGPERHAGAEFRPVRRLGRSRTEALEPVAKSVATRVALRGCAQNGWRCPECSRSMFSNRVAKAEYINVYPEGDIPEGLAAFWVDSGSDLNLCVRREWWRSVRRSGPFRGVLGWPLYVASPDSVEASPTLTEREDRGDQAAEIRKRRDWLVKSWGIKG